MAKVENIAIRDRIKELRRVPARGLIPNPKNWRRHPKAQADALRGILAEVGYAEPPSVKFEAPGVDALLRSLRMDLGTPHVQEPPSQIDKAAELQAKWGTETGQLWQIGRNRLLCADCREKADVARLWRDAERFRMVWTDPPYGVSYADKNKYLNRALQRLRLYPARRAPAIPHRLWRRDRSGLRRRHARAPGRARPQAGAGEVKPGLNPKPAAFAREYVKDSNATQAAIRAGYSRRTAAVQGFALLRKPRIKVEIERRLAKVGMSADEVLLELARIGRCDPQQLFDPDGKMLHPKDMPEGIRRAISSIEVNKGVIKVRFWSKTEALNLAGKTHKLFVDRAEVSGKDGAPLFDLEAWRRL